VRRSKIDVAHRIDSQNIPDPIFYVWDTNSEPREDGGTPIEPEQNGTGEYEAPREGRSIEGGIED